jgi:hypothetical protein
VEPDTPTPTNFKDNYNLEYDLTPTPTEIARFYDTQDVLLLMHFTSTTSTDLIGCQQIWIEDAMQLAFQVGL